jgi:carboxyl-terminal processing protease
MRRNPAHLCVLLVMFLPTSSITQADDKDDYELMRLFAETFQQIETNYVRDVDRRELMEAAIQGMLKHLDQYSNFIPPQEVGRFNQMVDQEFGGIGVTLNYDPNSGSLVVISPLPGTPAYRAGIRAGDRIVAIEGETTNEIRLSQAVKKLQGPVGRPVTISVIQDDDTEPRIIKLVRQLIKAPTVRGDHYREDGEWEFMLEGEPKIGLIRLSHFSRFTAEEVQEAVEGLVERDVQGLVVDLRFNPGGLLEAAIRMADMFLDHGNIVSVRGRNVPERSWDAKKGGTFPNFPMAILVNNYSASASEVLSACLQDNKRAVIIGERTWGKGSVQNVIQMEDGESALKLTTASYHRPSGVNIHRFPEMLKSDEWGVTPDQGYEIDFSRDDWRAWRVDRDRRDVFHHKDEEPEDASEQVAFVDTQLNKGLEYIKQQLSPSKPAIAESTDSAPKQSERADAAVAGDSPKADPAPAESK